MLRKINRINRKREFDEVKKKGRLINGNYFSLLIKCYDDKERRVGMVVSRKISGRAVDRNRIRRLIAEGVRRNLDLVPEGNRIVFLVKRSILGRGQKEIEIEIKDQISKIK